MKIAILQNFLDTIGGAEVVGLMMAREFGADIYTTNIDQEKIRSMGFADVLPRIISIGNIPKEAPYRQQMMLWYFSRLNLGKKYDFYILNGDWTLSAARKHKPNLWYVNATIREIWDLRDYVRNELIVPWKRPIFDMWTVFNRFLNKKHVREVGAIATNSSFTYERVKKYLARESTIINPPTDTKAYGYGKTGDYWLSVSRIIKYKRIDLQMKAFARLSEEKLVIIGPYEKSSTSLGYLEYVTSIKPSNVTLMEAAGTREELIEMYANCKGFITTCKDEDFGMTVVEAMASGKPVVAPKEGGYKETVLDGQTGTLVADADDQKLADAIKRISLELKDPSRANEYKNKCQARAQEYDLSVFAKKIRALMRSDTV